MHVCCVFVCELKMYLEKKSSASPSNKNVLINIFQAVLNAVKFFPYTEDPDTSYQLIRDMCKNKSMFAFCRAFIDFAQGIKLPIHNVRKSEIN